MQRITFFLLLIFLVSCKKSEISTPSTNESGLPTHIESSINVTQHMPAMLPKHLAMGVENSAGQSSQFINEAEYRYTYLAGDIFANGWTTWNFPSGQFARNFLQQTQQMGKTPVFTYYNLVPARGLNQDPAFANMNDSETMRKYFEDWKFILQICKEFGSTVIIHYEPDLLGYMQMYKDDAGKNTIKVSQSGYADAQGYTNDAKGLAQVILSMRDKYAPNVLLGWHASQWATGTDLVKGKNNPELLASQTATYYKSLGASFDLIFAEFADRDAGYDQLVNNKSNTMWTTDGSGTGDNMSDFERFRRFLKRLNQETGQKIMLWQIPMGNTKTQTCNNTSGHYKDNRPEYFMQPVLDSRNTSRLNDYAQAGVIAFLFGKGAAACTSYMDSANDGVTGSNESSDDDGGYLRKAVKAYYAAGAVTIP